VGCNPLLKRILAFLPMSFPSENAADAGLCLVMAGRMFALSISGYCSREPLQRTTDRRAIWIRADCGHSFHPFINPKIK
jgi:hypothetical protein